MKILVPIKRVVDYNVKIRIKPDGAGIDQTGVKMSMNPFDEIAVEEAVKLKEAGQATEIVVVTIGPAVAQDILRAGLAMGADRAILVATDLPTDTGVEPLSVAKILQKIVATESPNLIIMGKQAIDDDSNQTGQMLAALLGWAQGTFISKLTLNGDTAQIVREVDGGTETLSLKLPAIITTDLRLNTPRYASLPNIMKAKQKPLATTTPDELGAPIAPRLKLLKIAEPPKRQGGAKVADVDALIDALKNKSKVI